MRRQWFRAGVLALALTLGCAWKGYVERGDALLAVHDYDAAAAQYEKALQLRPGDAEIASKLEQARTGQVEQRAAQARDAIAAGDELRAIALAAEAFALLPSHTRTVALIDEVVTAADGKAKQLGAAGQFAAAMQLYDAILHGLPSATARVQAEVDSLAQAWVAQLSAAADAAAAAGRPATELLYRSKITALLGDGQAQRDAVRQQLEAAQRYVVRVAVKGKDTGTQTVALALLGRHAPSLLEVVSDDAKPAATLTLELGKPKFDDDQRSRQESVQYQSGTQQVPNPFYKSAQDDVLDEERRLVERENEVTTQQQYVAQYQGDVAREGDTPGVTTGAEQNLYNAENRLEAAQRAVVDQRNAVMRAKEKAASTPQTTDEPVYSTHTYAITTHVRTASVQVRAKLEHGDGRPPLTIDQVLSVSAEDDTHGAQSVAGIGENPLDLPSKDELAGRLYGEAVPLVGTVIAQSFADHRQALLGQASGAADAGERLELLMRYVISDPRQVDAQIIAEVLALSGVPDVGVLLTN